MVSKNEQPVKGKRKAKEVTMSGTEKVKKIESLTDEQRSRFGEWRDRWIKVGLCTDPADRPKFERAVAKCYGFAGLEPPKKVIWVDSPMELVTAAPVLAYRKDQGIAASTKLGKDTITTVVRDGWHKYIGGQFWVGGWWGSPSFVSFFREVCNLELPGDMDERAIAYQETTESACWWWPHKDFVMVSDRPRIIARDPQGRLHSEVGNAIEFRDGWGIASWHGTVIPVEWVRNRATLDPAIALTDRSVERRRAAAEIVGWARVLGALPHKVLDKDEDPEIGTLMSVDLPDAPDSRFVLVKCGTGRDFALPVPREVTTALEANAWTYDLKPLDLKSLETRT